jgi:hypothetical protein
LQAYLDISVVVLARPDESTGRLDSLGDHVIDQSVLVPQTELLELGGVVAVIPIQVIDKPPISPATAAKGCPTNLW